MHLNQDALAFKETDHDTLKESYFSPYIIPTIPHATWEYRNIPIPPGLHEKVIELLKTKIKARVSMNQANQPIVHVGSVYSRKMENFILSITYSHSIKSLSMIVRTRISGKDHSKQNSSAMLRKGSANATDGEWTGLGFSSCAAPLIWIAPLFQRVENGVDSEE